MAWATPLRAAALLLAGAWLAWSGTALAAEMVCDCPGQPDGYRCSVSGQQGSGKVAFSCLNTPLGNRVEITCQADESGLAWFCSRSVDGQPPQFLVAGLSDASTAQLLDDLELKCPCGWK